ncbi:MAG TPA: tetratricopeptide repeat protein [Thermoanaerobaculia bacterium]|nr:tetratricopeptide repeat protein [Thermoanaerobaculia bacterium]
MLCLACGADNPGEHGHCRRCQRPLVLPPAAASEEMGEWAAKDEPVSLEEHLLERVSALEEALQRTAEGVARLGAAVAKLDRAIVLGQAGAGAVFEMLEERGVVPDEACRGAWRHGLERELAAMELRERFAAARERVLAACGSAASRRLLGEAEEALAVHDGEKAIALFERALQRERGNLPLALFLAEAAFAGGDGSRALQLCETILAGDPRQFEALVYSGVLLHEQGDLAAAEQRLRQALRRDPQSFLARFALGSVLAGRGRPRLAARQLEKALELREVPRARFLLGRCLYEGGRAPEAVAHLRRAVADDPDLEEAHYLLGLASLDLGWRQRALASFRAAQRLNPRKLHYQDLVTFLSGRPTSPLPPVEGRPAEALAAGERLLARGDGRGAMRAAGTALRLAPDHPTVLISYAMVCLALGRLPELEVAARRVLALAAGDMLKATAAAALIAALRGAGRLREGNRVGRELLAGNPSSFAQTIAYYELAYNLAELEEDLDRALDYARRALDLAPEELRQFPLAALGWVHYKRREYAEAVDCLSRSSVLGPSSTTLTHLGMALLALGDEKKARGAFRRARSLEPRSGGLEERMMECMRSSSELAARVQERGSE